jgi:hypothetical protein
MVTGPDNQVGVAFRTEAGALVNTAFLVTAFC